MTVRIALLILVTGLFAVIWSGDKSDQIAAVDRPARVLVGRAGRQSRLGIVQKAAHENRTSISMTQVQQQLTAPFPPRIRAGTYLVVDKFGRTEIRVIGSQVGSAGNASVGAGVSDHYVAESPNGRWHYIRIEANASIGQRMTFAIEGPIR